MDINRLEGQEFLNRSLSGTIKPTNGQCQLDINHYGSFSHNHNDRSWRNELRKSYY
jgi:hypothetical protein